MFIHAIHKDDYPILLNKVSLYALRYCDMQNGTKVRLLHFCAINLYAVKKSDHY